MKEFTKSAVIQDDFGNETSETDLYATAIAAYRDETKRAKGESVQDYNKRIEVKTVKLYIKAHENKVYYIINDTHGSFDLF